MNGYFFKASQEAGHPVVSIVADVELRMLILQMIQDEGEVVHLSAVLF